MERLASHAEVASGSRRLWFSITPWSRSKNPSKSTMVMSTSAQGFWPVAPVAQFPTNRCHTSYWASEGRGRSLGTGVLSRSDDMADCRRPPGWSYNPSEWKSG
jgi:hypothetical protein